MNLFCNSLIFFDVYFTIRNPFSERSKRFKWYLSLMVLSTVLYIFFYYYTDHDDKLKAGFKYGSKIYYQILDSLLSAITIVAIVLVIHRLNFKGTSQELKQKVLKRHLVYFAMYFFFILSVN